MITVRELRIKTAMRAMHDVRAKESGGTEILEPDEFFTMAVATIDALFPHDPHIDNSKVPDAVEAV